MHNKESISKYSIDCHFFLHLLYFPIDKFRKNTSQIFDDYFQIYRDNETSKLPNLFYLFMLETESFYVALGVLNLAMRIRQTFNL